MDALAGVANVGLQNEVYALRKRCFLPQFLTVDHAFWKDLQQAHEDPRGGGEGGCEGVGEGGGGEVGWGPFTLAAAIMEHSYKHSPRDTLTRLATVCDTHGLPVPGDWATCEQEVDHVVHFYFSMSFSTANLWQHRAAIVLERSQKVVPVPWTVAKRSRSF